MDRTLRHVMLFFIVTFVWTWGCYFAIIGGGLDPYQGTGMILLICGGCSPTFAGLILAMSTYNRRNRIDYLKSLYQPRRIKAIWWLLILLIFPAVFAVSIGVNAAVGGTPPEMTNLKAVIDAPLTFFPLILLSFMSGPFSEELGWRGFALRPLLERFGFTRTSVVLGLIWGVWHLPLYFMPQTWHGQMGFAFTGFWLFLLMSVGLTAMMSLVYINTRRSILAAMLMHLCSNFTGQLLADVPDTVELVRGLLVFAIGAAVMTVMVLKGKDRISFKDEM